MSDEYLAHGSSELDADAVKLLVMGADPGLTFADLSTESSATLTNVAGAGLAGLLAGNMLRNRLGTIVEAQPSLPNNHSAVLRFRSRVISDTLNIPFREVITMRAIAPWRNSVADMLSYSLKTTGVASSRSSINANGELVKRYIAPLDLIERMAKPLKIIYGGSIGEFRSALGVVRDAPIISTIPMDKLMEILAYSRRNKLEFQCRAGTNIIVELADVDAYCSLYIPNPVFAFARITLTGAQMVLECYGEDKFDVEWSIDAGKNLLGLRDCKTLSYQIRPQKYAKILPIDEDERRRFIMWASDQHRIFSFGRYAVWRPGLLLDDLVQDFRVIMKLIDGGNQYDFAKE
jgi:hypothetical protein